MSLLMDSHRKTEEASRLADEPPALRELDNATSELTLAPMSEATPETTPRTAAPGTTARQAFATTPRVRRLALGALAASGIGIYFCWPAQPIAGASRPVPVVAPASATPAPLPAPTAPSSEAPAPLTPPPAPNAAAEASTLFAPRARPSKPSPVAGSAAPASALRLSKSATRPPLERAYDSLLTGRLDEAQRDYEQVLRSDAKNTDALLGLATIAARQGQTELAQSYYQRAFESDPSDATAQAGLINTRGQADPVLSESRLKSALAAQPESSALHFALGNLYARQSRWSEAQQAYFSAYSSEPDNADTLFNLAVSLDHLHQNQLAAQYYRMALTSPRVRSSSFDNQQASQRISELQP